MIHKIQRYIETNCLLTVGKPVIVGFSGGGDSVSLLYILNKLGYSCIAAHCNFRLRGDEADRDEQLCQEFADKYHIPFEKTDFDTRAYSAAQHISIEMAARELRYQWLETLRQQHDAQAIAVAHHRDDSTETMLINLIRGTGIHGLVGIRNHNGYIVRPLLAVGKDEINHFLQTQQLPFVTDSTNLSDIYTRNFIRLRLIPLMETINPSVRQTLSRTVEQVADAAQIYAQAIENAAITLLHKTADDEIELCINDLLKFPAPKTLLYELIKQYGFTSEVTDEIARAFTGASGKVFDAHLSDYKLLKDRNKLIIYQPSKTSDKTYLITPDGTNLEQLPLSLSIYQVAVTRSFKIDKSPSIATFDYDKLHFPLTLRRWQSGDWFIPFGMRGRQKLSDYFSDHQYSLRDKAHVWLLCSGENVIWLAGKRIDNRYRIDKQTKKALVITIL